MQRLGDFLLLMLVVLAAPLAVVLVGLPLAALVRLISELLGG